MKVTEEMIYAFTGLLDRARPAPHVDHVRAGLAAVFQMIDPVPADVNTIKDSDGDEWVRNSDDPMVWIYEDGTMFRTYRDIEERYGPITWDGKK